MKFLLDNDEYKKDEFGLELFFDKNKQSPQVDFLTEMINYYNESDRKYKENCDFIEWVHEMNQEKLQGSNINNNITRTVKTCESIESFLEEVLDDYKSFMPNRTNQNFPTILDTNESNVGIERQQEDSLTFRESQIQFAYALLIIQNDENYVEKLTLQVLQRLKSYNKLEEFEIHYLEYLFKNYNLHNDFIMENFKFIYERLFINLCTDIIKENDLDKISEMLVNIDDKMLRKIFTLCRENKRFKDNIKDLLYSLFFISNCDDRLLLLLNYI